MNKISTLGQLQSLQGSTMIYAIVVCLVAILIAFIISNLIPFEGGVDKSYVKRRIAYIVVGVVACLSFYLFNDIYVKRFIVNAGFKAMFVKTNLQCLGIIVGGYIVLGLGLMFGFRHSKFGSILGKGKE